MKKNILNVIGKVNPRAAQVFAKMNRRQSSNVIDVNFNRQDGSVIALSDRVLNVMGKVEPRRYVSQPMPVTYSKLKRIFFDHTTPNAMQEAFMGIFLRG